MNNPVDPLPYVYGGPQCSGRIKLEADDFVVEEQLGFQPQGSGEHAFLWIEKQGQNTEYVARLLARFAGVRQRDIGFAGLKDRHARTRQWFSVWLPGKPDPDWSLFNNEYIQILRAERHARKLQRGVLQGNRFEIRVRCLHGDKTRLLEQAQQMSVSGFANYFGEQRFGRQGGNLQQVGALFDGQDCNREQRGILLSAARSFLFNHLLAHRVEHGSWNRLAEGEPAQLSGSHSHFIPQQIDETLEARLASHDIQPTAWLPGIGKPEPLAAESELLADYADWVEGLRRNAVQSARRATRVLPEQLNVSFESDEVLLICFGLPAGSYATALLRELVEWNDTE